MFFTTTYSDAFSSMAQNYGAKPLGFAEMRNFVRRPANVKKVKSAALSPLSVLV
jgi:hypothetical protein